MLSKSIYLRSASVAALATVPAILGCTLLGATGATATPYVVTIDQEGPNVVATSNAGADFNLSGLLPNPFGGIRISPQIQPSTALLRLSSSGQTFSNARMFTEPGAPTAIGGGVTTPASSSNGGPPVAFERNVFLNLPSDTFLLDLSPTYVSGDPLASSQNIWNNATFASLGITPGTYTWSWGPASDQSFTIAAGVTPTPEIPLPATLPLFASGLGALGLLGWRRKRRAQAVA